MAIPPVTKCVALAATTAVLAGVLGGLTTPTLAATGTTAVHESVRVSPSFFGLHDGSGQAYDHVAFGALRLWDAGVTWKQIETSPGVFNWSRLDSLVSAAQAHHVEVTLVLGQTPSSYADSPTQAPRNLSMFTRYVTAVMNRYRSFNGQRGIAAYQVWNEGNVSNFWTGTPAQLAELTGIVDQVRDTVDPEATVVAPSFAVRLSGQRAWLREYQSQLVDGSPVWDSYDVNALSLYPKARYGDRLGGPEDAMRLLETVRRQMREIGVPSSKPIWATEVNYGVVGGGVANGDATPISPRRQVANVLRTYLLGAAHGLTRVFWYRYDWGRTATGGTLGNTLLADPGNPAQVRVAGLALRTAERWLDGRLVARNGKRPCARDRRGTFHCVVRHDGVVRRIYWNPHREVRVEVPRRASAQKFGRTIDRAGRHTVRVGFQPMMVRVRR